MNRKTRRTLASRRLRRLLGTTALALLLARSALAWAPTWPQGMGNTTFGPNIYPSCELPGGMLLRDAYTGQKSILTAPQFQINLNFQEVWPDPWLCAVIPGCYGTVIGTQTNYTSVIFAGGAHENLAAASIIGVSNPAYVTSIYAGVWKAPSTYITNAVVGAGEFTTSYGNGQIFATVYDVHRTWDFQYAPPNGIAPTNVLNYCDRGAGLIAEFIDQDEFAIPGHIDPRAIGGVFFTNTPCMHPTTHIIATNQVIINKSGGQSLVEVGSPMTNVMDALGNRYNVAGGNSCIGAAGPRTGAPDADDPLAVMTMDAPFPPEFVKKMKAWEAAHPAPKYSPELLNANEAAGQKMKDPSVHALFPHWKSVGIKTYMMGPEISDGRIEFRVQVFGKLTPDQRATILADVAASSMREYPVMIYEVPLSVLKSMGGSVGGVQH